MENGKRGDWVAHCQCCGNDWLSRIFDAPNDPLVFEDQRGKFDEICPECGVTRGIVVGLNE